MILLDLQPRFVTHSMLGRGTIKFIRGGSRAAATSKMERFVITVNGFQLKPHLW